MQRGAVPCRAVRCHAMLCHAMGPCKAVLLGLLLGALGAAACGECCGTGLPPAPGPAAPRSPTPGLRPRDPHPRLTALTPSVPAGSHSLRYFLTGMTDPGPGMPQFVAVGYVDDKIFGKYDSKSRWVHPIVEMLPQEDQEHWVAQTQMAREGELEFSEGLHRLQVRYNRSGGEHCRSHSAMELGQELCGAGASAPNTLRVGCAPCPAIVGCVCVVSPPWGCPVSDLTHPIPAPQHSQCPRAYEAPHPPPWLCLRVSHAAEDVWL